MVRKRNPILQVLANIDLYISMTGLVLLILITFLGTFMRYLLNEPFIWQEEVQMILVVWIVFWGMSVAFRTKSHIAIEILVEALPQKAQTVIRVIVDVITAGTLIFLTYVEFNRVMQLFASGRSTSILRIPQAYNYLGVVLACIFMLVNFFIVEVRFFRELKGGFERK